MTTNNTHDGFGGDEEDTLPPVPIEPKKPGGPRRPFAQGDFRTYETTIAPLRVDDFFEVRLRAGRPPPPRRPESRSLAHFAVDEAVAGQIARHLERSLSSYSRLGRPPSLPPRLPDVEDLDGPGTDLLFAIDDAPAVSIEQESGGDRICLSLCSDEAWLLITVQLGVALVLRDFFAGAPLPVTSGGPAR